MIIFLWGLLTTNFARAQNNDTSCSNLANNCHVFPHYCPGSDPDLDIWWEWMEENCKSFCGICSPPKDDNCNNIPEIFFEHGDASRYCGLREKSALTLGLDCSKYGFDGGHDTLLHARIGASLDCDISVDGHCWLFDVDGEACSGFQRCDANSEEIGYEPITEILYVGSTFNTTCSPGSHTLPGKQPTCTCKYPERYLTCEGCYVFPSTSPSVNPSTRPSFEPTTSGPSVPPSTHPTGKPVTSAPSTLPSNHPTEGPSVSVPSQHPSILPTSGPSVSVPSQHPSIHPTSGPSTHPNVHPTQPPSLFSAVASIASDKDCETFLGAEFCGLDIPVVYIFVIVLALLACWVGGIIYVCFRKNKEVIVTLDHEALKSIQHDMEIMRHQFGVSTSPERLHHDNIFSGYNPSLKSEAVVGGYTSTSSMPYLYSSSGSLPPINFAGTPPHAMPTNYTATAVDPNLHLDPRSLTFHFGGGYNNTPSRGGSQRTYRSYATNHSARSHARQHTLRDEDGMWAGSTKSMSEEAFVHANPILPDSAQSVSREYPSYGYDSYSTPKRTPRPFAIRGSPYEGESMQASSDLTMSELHQEDLETLSKLILYFYVFQHIVTFVLDVLLIVFALVESLRSTGSMNASYGLVLLSVLILTSIVTLCASERTTSASILLYSIHFGLLYEVSNLETVDDYRTMKSTHRLTLILRCLCSAAIQWISILLLTSTSFALMVALAYTILCLISFALQPQEIKPKRMQKMATQKMPLNIADAAKSTHETIKSVQGSTTSGTQEKYSQNDASMQKITIEDAGRDMYGGGAIEDDEPTVGEVFVAGKWITAAIFPEGKENWNAVIMESSTARKAKIVGKHFLGLPSDRVRPFEPVTPMDPFVGSWKIERVINMDEISRKLGKKWVKENGFSYYFSHNYEETITKTRDGFSISSSDSMYVNTYSFVKQTKGKLSNNGKTFRAKTYYSAGKVTLLHDLEDNDGLPYHFNVARHIEDGNMICEICLVGPTGREAKCVQIWQPKPLL